MDKKNKKETPVQEVSTDIVPVEKNEVKLTEEKDFDIDGFLLKRQEFITKVNKIMVKGSDYHEIQGKKSLAKGGAEKIASIFGWSASFTKDTDVVEAFGDIKGLISFVCDLRKGDSIVGQGRGAATLAKNAGDPNKTIKMAQKSAFIDAVLRASGLSDFFTQDLEDHPEHLQSDSKTSYPPTEKQLEFIQNLMDQKRVTEAWVMDQGFDLKNLTGGKGGTASELIELLKGYIPTYAVTVEINGLTKDANEMVNKLNQCKDPAELMELKKLLTKYRTEGRFTKDDLVALKEVYERNEKEIMPV